MKCQHISLVISSGGQRDIDAVAASIACADFILETCSREQCPASLVKRYCHHIVAVVKGVLDAVAVMDIDIEIKDTPACFGKNSAGKGIIIKITEPCGLIRAGVMKAA